MEYFAYYIKDLLKKWARSTIINIQHYKAILTISTYEMPVSRGILSIN